MRHEWLNQELSEHAHDGLHLLRLARTSCNPGLCLWPRLVQRQETALASSLDELVRLGHELGPGCKQPRVGGLGLVEDVGDFSVLGEIEGGQSGRRIVCCGFGEGRGLDDGGAGEVVVEDGLAVGLEDGFGRHGGRWRWRWRTRWEECSLLHFSNQRESVCPLQSCLCVLIEGLGEAFRASGRPIECRCLPPWEQTDVRPGDIGSWPSDFWVARPLLDVSRRSDMRSKTSDDVVGKSDSGRLMSGREQSRMTGMAVRVQHTGDRNNARRDHSDKNQRRKRGGKDSTRSRISIINFFFWAIDETEERCDGGLLGLTESPRQRGC